MCIRDRVGAMYGGDRARKINLVEYGFRLPSAMDNRPQNFDEFMSLLNQTIYVSACLLYTSPSPRDRTRSRMPSSA